MNAQQEHIGLDITPEAIIEGGSGGYHVIAFEPSGYHALRKASGDEGDRALTIFRSAPDAEEYIAGIWDRIIGGSPDPIVQRVSRKGLLRVIGVAESEGVRWYLMNPPSYGDATGYLLSDLRKTLDSGRTA